MVLWWFSNFLMGKLWFYDVFQCFWWENYGFMMFSNVFFWWENCGFMMFSNVFDGKTMVLWCFPMFLTGKLWFYDVFQCFWWENYGFMMFSNVFDGKTMVLWCFPMFLMRKLWFYDVFQCLWWENYGFMMFFQCFWLENHGFMMFSNVFDWKTMVLWCFPMFLIGKPWFYDVFQCFWWENYGFMMVLWWFFCWWLNGTVWWCCQLFGAWENVVLFGILGTNLFHPTVNPEMGVYPGW